jgi:transposase-like protein
MQRDQFSKIIENLSDMTFEQRKCLMDQLGEGDPLQQIREILEDGVKLCPHCKSDDFGKWGKSHGLPRYRCRSCNKTFNPLTNTPLARLRLKERWLDFTKALLDGESVRKSAKTCGVHKSTTFRWRHRFLQMPADLKSSVLSGIAEADEMFLLHSRKGQRNLNRPARKRGGKAKKSRRSGEHACILVARDRAGNTVDHVSHGFDKEIIAKVLNPVLAKDAILCSDGLGSIRVNYA